MRETKEFTVIEITDAPNQSQQTEEVVMQKAYSRVIDLIADDKINHCSISLALAKANPKVFLAIHDAVNSVGVEQERYRLESSARNIILGLDAYDGNHGKIPAIKFIRDKAGLGLKEAKDLVEKLETEPPKPFARDLNALLINLLGEKKERKAKYDDEGEF
jgi:ribosomal protein L7/L12